MWHICISKDGCGCIFNALLVDASVGALDRRKMIFFEYIFNFLGKMRDKKSHFSTSLWTLKVKDGLMIEKKIIIHVTDYVSVTFFPYHFYIVIIFIYHCQYHAVFFQLVLKFIPYF